jgi:hypothetical protein
LRLVGAVTEGSGSVNEDGLGFLGTAEDVGAAWVFDGVTGINDRNYLPRGSDAQWLVECAHAHLVEHAGRELPLPEILARLVDGLIADWREITKGLVLSEDYDPPAACLVLVKRYGRDWKAVRLGDSCLLARDSDGAHRIHAAWPNNVFDNWLAREAEKRRQLGQWDVKALLAEFRPQLLKGRNARNREGGYSILEASRAALRFAEYLDLGYPSDILLCTDGYYRAVDHYGLFSNETLIEASSGEGGIARALEAIRKVEAGDPECRNYPRFKPADDATALMLSQDQAG